MARPTFKDVAAADLASFLNPEEFATVHTIDGRDLLVLIETDANGRSIPSTRGAAPPSYAEGVSLWHLVFYVDPIELGYRPEEDQNITFDGQLYRVVNVGDEDGLYRITLEASRA
ncbi:hypothetical protein SAMN05216312_102220 [Cohnella sp. OV330]|uniref:hypothetical protein n=1 Tax=Cohnella sp. OV330 TaxID=1855288 RepID=UPI0008DEC26B|nr:hypothetical protein [Cohnella sp. OV330]SFA91629.1 hypothetical protein SAMN05216312_102220 [Cohnella sp. OV330]